MRKAIVTTLTKNGRTTIPKKVREYLRIKPHDKIEFVIDHGIVKVRLVEAIEAGFGRVSPKNKPEKFSEIRREFEDNVAKEQIIN